MALDEPRDNDEMFGDKDLNYVIDRDLLEQIKPVKVDYVNTPMGSGFNILSSMQRGASCGASCSC